MTKLINASIVAYSIICIALGAQAYFAPREGHEPSVVSLIAASTIGVLLLGSLYLWTKNPRAGRITSAVLALVCIGNFLPKALSKGFYPNGLMAGLSIALFLLLGAGHMMAKKASD